MRSWYIGLILQYIRKNAGASNRRLLLVRRLGAGTFGEVGLYRSPGDDLVAIKQVRPGLLSQGVTHSALKEIQSLTVLENVPHIARVSDVRISLSKEGQTDTLIIMPVYESDLAIFIRNVPLDVRLKQLSTITRQLVTGLYYTKKLNIIHRDIKTCNIFVDYQYSTKDGQLQGDVTCYLGDFGLSTWLPRDRSTARPLVVPVYTQSYRPPEAYRDPRYTAAADVWALGVTLLNYITGRVIPETELIPFSFLADALDGPSPNVHELVGGVNVRRLISQTVIVDGKFISMLELMLLYNPLERLSIDIMANRTGIDTEIDYSPSPLLPRCDWTEGRVLSQSLYTSYYIAVIYLVDFSIRRGIGPSTFVLALDILDRYLSATKPSCNCDVNSASVACYWIATKLNSYGIDASQLLFHGFGMQQLKESELLVLQVLKYRLESCEYEEWVAYLMSKTHEEVLTIYESMEEPKIIPSAMSYSELIKYATNYLSSQALIVTEI